MTRPPTCSWCGHSFAQDDERVVSIDWINHVADYLHGVCYERAHPSHNGVPA